MNRRRFIKRGIGALTSVALFPTDLFRYATGQLPRQILANPNSCAFEMTDTEIALSLYDGKSVAARLDQFGKACAAQRPKLAETRADTSYPVRQTMDSILAANPGVTREQAFLKAVVEIAEDVT